MPFENFDNKVRQAAEQHHPSYDEKAWAKMEKLLDRELPRGKNRRRIVFFLLLFLLLGGGGAWLMTDKPWRQTQIASDKELPDKAVVNSGKETNKTTKENISEDKNQDQKSVSGHAGNNPEMVETKDNSVADDADNSNNPIVLNEKKANNITKNTGITRTGINKQEEFDMKVTDPGKTAKIGKPDDNIPSVSPGKSDDREIKSDADKKQTTISPDNKNDNTALQSGSDKVEKNEVTGQLPKAGEKNQAKVNKNKKSSSFFFTFSAGPDLSYIQPGNPGKVKLLAGAGVGYIIKNRVTIRTGFYTARKVYTAAKDEYKPSVQPPTTYLDRIDANCKVYEIPLNFAYNFGKSEKQNMFASAGLSSFIMKRETYDYIYLYPGNPVPYVHTKTIENEYKHYFSVLTISGGYQRKINKKLSLSAEPYIKLPLGGVGYGHVKLRSAGILFSASIKPFN